VAQRRATEVVEASVLLPTAIPPIPRVGTEKISLQIKASQVAEEEREDPTEEDTGVVEEVVVIEEVEELEVPTGAASLLGKRSDYFPKLLGPEPTLSLQPEIHVGGRLQRFQEAWGLITVNKFVLETVSKGFALEFIEHPPFSGIIAPNLSEEESELIAEEVDGLLAKGAIEPVCRNQAACGFYSTYFLVPKKDGGTRPILNLKKLNCFMAYAKFKMESLRSIISSVKPEAYLASLDLKDAYLHIPIRPVHWRFLRFSFRGRNFQWRVIPFGLTSAPRVFTYVVRPLLAVLRTMVFQVHAYLDDLLVVASNPQEVRTAINATVQVFLRAGFIMNRYQHKT
jgi:hypothetical protein